MDSPGERKWARPTIRLLMGLVLFAALGLGIGLPAIEVHGVVEKHMHTYIGTVKGNRMFIAEWVSSPFWPRYWRRLRGKKWRGLQVCDVRYSHMMELCEITCPEMVSDYFTGEKVGLNPSSPPVSAQLQTVQVWKPDPSLAPRFQVGFARVHPRYRPSRLP